MSDATPQVQPAPLATVPSPTTPSAAPHVRLWPGLVLIVIQWLCLNVPGWLAPGTRLQINFMQWGAIGVVLDAGLGKLSRALAYAD